jgi:N-acyl homoserine lactone hydrolase
MRHDPPTHAAQSLETSATSSDEPDPAIKAVHAVTTGCAGQHPEHRYGTRKPLLWWVLTSRRWVRIPIHCYLLEHRQGLVLFDAGLDPAIASDPSYIESPIGRFLLHRIFRLHIGPEDALDRQLSALGFRASDVHTAVFSHLHFDHVGGIAHIPQADLLVSKDEWAQLSTPQPEKEWILREHIELPNARWRPIEFKPTDDPRLAPFGGAHDVMGDGSMILLPTPGHSPGSMSMLVRSTGKPPLLLVGDLAYEVDALLNDRVPGVGDAPRLRESFAKVRELRDQLPGLVILPAHDASAVEALAATAW